MNAPVRRLMSAEVAPTAASDVLPANLPTTITSAALNSSCRMPVSASGRENIISFGSSAPFSISSSFVLAMGTSLKL